MKSKVYFTRIITPEKVLEMYEVLGKELIGKIAVKLHSGEEGNQNFLKPDFWRPIIDKLNGTVVECNTAYEGSRNTTEKHLKTIEKHGWSKYFNVDFLRYFVLSKSSDRDFLNKLTSFYRNSYCNNENICRIRYILETKNEHEFTMQETLTSFVFNEVYATDYKTGNCSLKYKSLHDLAMFCFTYEINSIRKEINISSKEKEENRIKMLNSLKTPKPKIRTLKKKNYELEGQMSFDDLEY